MIDVVFLYRAGHVNSGAKIMRCDQLCTMANERLGDRFRFSTQALPRPGHVGRQRKLPEALRGKVVIFLKRADRALDPGVLADLRQTVRAMCLDFVDARMMPVPTVPMDVMIAASYAGLLAIEWDLAPQMEAPPVARLVMHHHDPSLTWVDRSADTKARLAYFGLRENAYLPDAVLGNVEIPDYDGSHVDRQALVALQSVNAHYAVREEPGRNRLLEFKPFTKGFNAAASGSVVLVNRQVHDAVELLGEDYPFLIDAPTPEAVRAGIDRLREAAGGPDWARALEAMAELSAASSVDAVTRQLGEALDVALNGEVGAVDPTRDALLLAEDSGLDPEPEPRAEAGDLEGSRVADPVLVTQVATLAEAAEDEAPTVPLLETAVVCKAPSALSVVSVDALPDVEEAPLPPELVTAPPDWDIDVGPEDRVLFVGDGWLPEGLSEDAVLALDGSEDPDEVRDFAPTVVVCHWLGLTLAVLEQVDLGVVHTVAIGPTVEGILLETVLVEAGLSPITPRLFRRLGPGLEVTPVSPDSRMPMRAYRRWGQMDPTVLVATCMKDEGPFILEWIAWHKALGVSDFIVFSNDCTDGTDDILDRLDALGVITHLENPAKQEGSTYFQPVALKHLHGMPGFAHADFVISMDVDEFINVHAGDGHLRNLLELVEPFDALSMSELNHGSNWREEFEPGWVTDQFPAHQIRDPGKWKAARGVKTITRLSPKLMQVRNHRPDFADGATVVWLNGSGDPVDALIEDPKQNGMDCRGAYNLVTLEHYPLRSVESYLVKKYRGDVVIEGKSVGQRYWRLRDRNEVVPASPMLNAAAAREAYGRLLQDPELAALHMTACKRHAERIGEVAKMPDFQELRAWINEQGAVA